MTSDEIEALLLPTLTRMGFELADLELKTGGRHGLLRVFIDGPDGVGLGDCEAVSRQISAILDVEDPIPGEYSLEVSSPGLDRRLRRREHFERFAGAEVKVQLYQPQGGRRRFRGRLDGLSGEMVKITVDSVEYTLPLKDIEIARLVPVL